jgi:hypothetical protein
MIMEKNMNVRTNVIPTNIINIPMKINLFAKIIMRAVEDGIMLEEARIDTLTLLELIGMGTISKNCNHTMTRTMNLRAHERTPLDWGIIPALVEDMKMSVIMPRGTTVNLNLRTNTVACLIVSNTLAMVEVGCRFMNPSVGRSVIVCIGIMSLTHLGMLPSCSGS